MNESLMVANVYAAYTAANKSDKNVSELSRMLKNGTASETNKENETRSMQMDTVIISKEALEKLSGMSLAADRK